MRVKVTEIYTMEQLLPVVAQLTNRFVSCESTSVTYERARYLMEAVIYCIAHFYEAEEKEELMSASIVSAEKAYQLGYENVIQKVRKVQESYNELIGSFCHYGNRNYRDTVEKALPAFFLYYDPRFAPMENIITMDYPLFGLNMELCGIDMIEQYVNAISREQQYLKRYPIDFVVEKLRSYHPTYEGEFFNIKEILDLQLSLL